LYGHENWFVTLREERTSKVFKNMMPRRIFGPKREDLNRMLEKTAQ
jgi:hypothetical protein